MIPNQVCFSFGSFEDWERSCEKMLAVFERFHVRALGAVGLITNVKVTFFQIHAAVNRMAWAEKHHANPTKIPVLPGTKLPKTSKKTKDLEVFYLCVSVYLTGNCFNWYYLRLSTLCEDTSRQRLIKFVFNPELSGHVFVDQFRDYLSSGRYIINWETMLKTPPDIYEIRKIYQSICLSIYPSINTV